MPRPSKTLLPGSISPDFALTTADGTPWRLQEHLPVALFFLRGTW